MDVLDGVVIEGKSSFGGEFGASHCNQWWLQRGSSQITLGRICFNISVFRNSPKSVLQMTSGNHWIRHNQWIPLPQSHVTVLTSTSPVNVQMVSTRCTLAVDRVQ